MCAYAAWHQMVPICMEWWCTEANEATQTHCYNPVAPAYPVWAYYAYGRQADAKRILLASPPANWRRQPGRPASRGSAPSNRIWNNTTLRSPKQQIWLRTAICGGWCRRMALRNLKSCIPETTTTTVFIAIKVVETSTDLTSKHIDSIYWLQCYWSDDSAGLHTTDLIDPLDEFWSLSGMQALWTVPLILCLLHSLTSYSTYSRSFRRWAFPSCQLP